MVTRYFRYETHNLLPKVSTANSQLFESGASLFFYAYRSITFANEMASRKYFVCDKLRKYQTWLSR